MPPPAHTPDASRLKSPPPPPPPLPPHLDNLAHSLLARLHDLHTHQIPQLADCRGPLSFHDELAAAVRAELAGCKRDLEEFKLEVDDLQRARERLAAGEHVKVISQRLESATKLYRQAVVTSKRQIDAFSHLSARDELLSSNNTEGGRDSPGPYGSVGRGGVGRARSPLPGQSADDALMSATSDVTEGLRRTLQLMQSEVDRSLVSNELLESQTQTMQLTSDEYSSLSSLMTASKSLITSLERADVIDRLLLFGAFAFFAAVCAHIFKKRVLDRGVRLAGALGRVAAKGGSVVAGAAGKVGAGEHVRHAAEEGGAISEVKREVLGEIAQATAAATAVVTAIRAGVTSLAGGRRSEEPLVAPAVAPFENVVPSHPAREERAVPVSASSADYTVEEAYDDEDEDEDVEDAPLFPADDDPSIPSTPTTVAISSSSSSTLSSTPSPSSPSSDPAPPTPPTPATSLTLSATPSPQAGEGLFASGDENLHSAPPLPTPIPAATPAAVQEEVPEAQVEAEVGVLEDELSGLEAQIRAEREAELALEQGEPEVEEDDEEEDEEETAPAATPSLPEIPELAGVTPAILPDEKPDLPTVVAEEEEAAAAAEEQVEAEAAVHTPTPTAAAEEKLFTPLSTLRPSRPDLDAQLGGIEQIVGEKRPVVPSPSASPSPSPASGDASLSAPPGNTIPMPSATATAYDLPLPLDYDLEVPSDVPGLEGTTVPLSSESVKEGDVPALDVEETGAVPAEEESVELPIDLEKEQSVWDEAEAAKEQADEAEEVHETLSPAAASETAEEVEEEAHEQQKEQEDEESLLEAQLERSFGGARAIAREVVRNATAAVERAVSREKAAAEVEEEAEEDEQEGIAHPFGAYKRFDGATPTEEEAPVAEAVPSVAAEVEEEQSATSLPVDEAEDREHDEEIEEDISETTEDAAAPLPEATPEPTSLPAATPTPSPAVSSDDEPLPPSVVEAISSPSPATAAEVETAPPAAQAPSSPSPSFTPTPAETPSPITAETTTLEPTSTAASSVEATTTPAIPSEETVYREPSTVKQQEKEEVTREVEPTQAAEAVVQEEVEGESPTRVEQVDDENEDDAEGEAPPSTLEDAAPPAAPATPPSAAAVAAPVAAVDNEDDGDASTDVPAAPTPAPTPASTPTPSSPSHVHDDDEAEELEDLPVVSDANIPNSEAIYPDASIDDDEDEEEEEDAAPSSSMSTAPSATSTAAPTPSAERKRPSLEDFDDDDDEEDDDAGVFSTRADGSDEVDQEELHRAEERLHELEEEGGLADEFDAATEEDEHRRDEL